MERIERLAKAIAETGWAGDTVEEILASVEDLPTELAIFTLEEDLLNIQAQLAVDEDNLEDQLFWQTLNN